MSTRTFTFASSCAVTARTGKLWMLSLTVSAMGAHTRADGRPRELSFICPGMRSGRHIPTTCPNLRNNEILTKAKSDAHELGIMQQWRFCAAGYLHWLEEFEAGRGAPGR